MSENPTPDPHTEGNQANTGCASLAESTREERMARLRAQVNGTAKSRSLGTADTGNFLMGLALHACARSNEGLKLSGLEQLLFTGLKRLLPADELAEMGRVYEQARARGAAAFPAEVTRLAVSDSYGGADFRGDLVSLGERVLLQPNCSVVDMASLPQGAELDSPEFITAMREQGCGLTVVVDSTQPRSQLVPPPDDVTVRLRYFDCIKGTGDSFFGPSDEIYWGCGTGSDAQSVTEYFSPEFGNVDAGDRRNFSADTFLFNGGFRRTLMVDIQCWEKDRGGFWNDVRNALADIAEYCADGASDIIDNGDKEDAALGAVIAIVSALMGALLDLILGSDDLIQHRTIAINRTVLQRLTEDAHYWNFVGENAHYKLYMDATIEPKGPGHLFCTVLEDHGAGWQKHSMQIHARDPVLVAPPLPEDDDILLYCLYHSWFEDKISIARYMHDWTADDYIFPANLEIKRATAALYKGGSINWAGLQRVSGTNNSDSYRAVSGMKHQEGIVYPQPTDHTEVAMGAAITVDPRGNRMGRHFFFYDRDSNDLCYSHSDNFSKSLVISSRCGSNPAAAVFDGKLHLVYRCSDDPGGRLAWIRADEDGSNWQQEELIADSQRSGLSPSLAVFKDKLYCAWREKQDIAVWLNTLDKGAASWSGRKQPGVCYTLCAPTLAAHRDKLYCVYSSRYGYM
ncbi:hypothetical protein [Microbulbifer taiwanensis]|uniref:Exo-alpha-sialidase n=1 Tax=Microbulbifer taiwanensis TaxID=986746 RepID=A0ABW1YWH4_9GAMM|nr:hypothetical protein [Microbulbifer taiwanensis]